ncbi:MAG: ABC transporter substrate-binding protein [Chloroflexi bacterium]|nr:ABC transporter substrate-binding protein [Chloroflexota bacterium]
MPAKKTLSCLLTFLALLVTSCAPAATPAVSPKAPATTSETDPTAARTAAPAAPSPTAKLSVEQPRYGGVLLISHNGDPPSYDPLQESTLQSTNLVVPAYSGIVQHDPMQPTKVIGDLAEKWDMSPDGKAYIFHLHKDVKWHDGNPLTSEDARFSLEVVRTPPRGVVSPRQEWLKAVDKIEASDKDTLRVTLKYPSASFLHNLGDGRMMVVPRRVFEAKGSMKKDVLGTGAYRFKSHEAGISWSLVKNPNYFLKDRPYLDGITWYIITDSATRLAALRTHRVHMTSFGTPGLTAAQAEIVRKELRDNVVVDRYPGLIFHAVWMPTSKSPWNDIRVRRAVDLTLDRPKVIKVAMEGGADVGGFMPPGEWGLPQEELLRLPGYRQPKDADIAEAKRLISEAGYAGGIKMTVLTRNLQQLERASLSVKDQLAQIGIDLTVSVRDSATTFDLLYKRNYDIAVFSGSASFDDPDQVFGQQFISGVPRNFSDITDERIDKWFDEQARTLDPVRRRQTVFEMQRRMHDLVPASILYWATYDLGHWKEVRNFKPGIGISNNVKLQDVWLAK